MKLRSAMLSIAVLAGIFAAPQAAQAATVKMTMHNCEFRPWSVVAAPGDTIEIQNFGGAKRLESYVGQSYGPQPVNTGETISIIYDGTFTGLMANDVSPSGPCRATVTDGTCSGMCAKITTQAPSNPPGTPVITTPAQAATLTSNTVFFSGTAANAWKVRLHVQPTNQTFYATLSGSNWSVNRFLPNNAYTATVTTMHIEGFESAPSSVTFNVSGQGDIAAPEVFPGNPMTLAGNTTPLQIGRTYVGHGSIRPNGVVQDDREVRKVSATIRNLDVGSSEEPINLQCWDPAQGGAAIPCNATTNNGPTKLQYTSLHYMGLTPGRYVLTVTAEDGIGQPTTAVQDLIMIFPAA